MNKENRLIKGIIRAFSISILFSAILFIESCNNDNGENDPELFTLPGVYTFSEALLQTKVSMVLNLGFGDLPINFPEGTDITDQLAGGLLEEAPCDNAENAAVELKSNNELFFTCNGESNELKAGTWEYKEIDKILNLNLSSPPLSFAIPLKIEDVVIDEKNEIIAGTIKSFPLTRDLLLSFIPSYLTATMTSIELEALKSQFPPLLQVDVDIKFQKVKE